MIEQTLLYLPILSNKRNINGKRRKALAKQAILSSHTLTKNEYVIVKIFFTDQSKNDENIFATS